MPVITVAVEPALAVETRAAAMDHGAGGHRAIDLLDDLVELNAIDDGTHADIVEQAIILDDGLRLAGQRFDKGLEDLPRHVNALGGGTELTRIEIGSIDREGSCLLDIHGLVDDQRVLAAQFQDHFLERAAAGFAYATSGCLRTHEQDRADVRVIDDRLARTRPVAEYQVDDTRGQVREREFRNAA